MKLSNYVLKSKKIFISLAVAIVLSLSAMSGLFFNLNSLKSAHAYSTELTSLISNYNFSSPSPSTTTIQSPRNWSFLSTSESSSIKHGILNVHSDYFNEYAKNLHELEDSPGVYEEDIENISELSSSNEYYQHMFINSVSGQKRAGYSTSTFTLAKNSFYSFKFYVKTSNNSAKASIYLTGLSDTNAVSSIENFTTNGNWDTYTIYVQTSNFNEETNVGVEFWLGGKNNTSSGAVFLNKVIAMQHSNTSYNLILQHENVGKYVDINLSNESYTPVSNPSFEEISTEDTNIITGFKTIARNISDSSQMLKAINPNNFGQYPDTVSNPNTNYNTNNTNVLFMYNETAGSLGIESTEFEIKKASLYRISVWAKSNSGESINPIFRLVEVNEENTDIKSKDVKISTSENTTSPTTNNWVQYSIYVEGHPHLNKTVKIQLLLGTETENTAGYVFFDDIQSQLITYSQYTTGSTDTSTSAQLSFNTIANTMAINNGAFNLFNPASTTLKYPLAPRNWVLSTTDSNFNTANGINGVINTKTEEYEKFIDELSNNQNTNQNYTVSQPGLTPVLRTPGNTVANTSNYVLSIGNPTLTSQTYTSENITLNASSYYKLSFLVNTQFTSASTNDGVSVLLNSSQNKLFEISNISTDRVWAQYNVYIYTDADYTATLSLSLINTKGFTFFDDVELTTISETVYNSATTNEYNKSYVVNLNKESFNLFTTNGNDFIKTPFNFTGVDSTTNTTSQFGIINTNDLPHASELIDLYSIDSAPNSADNNILFINSGNTDTFYSVKSNKSYTFESGKYYKFSVYVKTLNIDQNTDNIVLNDKDVAYPYGASIRLTSFNDYFYGINTEDQKTSSSNLWQQYTFYISPSTTLTSTLELSLGTKNAYTSGFAFFDEIIIETIEKDAYVEEIENIDLNSNKLVLTELAADETPSPTTPDDFEGNDFNWLLASSLLTSLAVLIAVIGSMLRKVEITRRPKVKTSYDRKHTIEVELNKKERIAFRKNIISDLKLEFDEIDKEIESFLTEVEKQEKDIQEKQLQQKQKYEGIQKALLVEINTITETRNSLSEKIFDEAELKLQQAKLDKEIQKLKDKELKTQKQAEIKENKLEALKVKREKYLQQQEARKKLIQEEIEIIEREIEQIAKEEEIMWTEYRKAKEEAKKQKLEYKASKHSTSKTKSTTKKTKNEVEIEIVPPSDDQQN